MVLVDLVQRVYNSSIFINKTFYMKPSQIKKIVSILENIQISEKATSDRENLPTPYIEGCQILGIYINSEKDFWSKVPSVISKNLDWNPQFISEIKSRIKSKPQFVVDAAMGMTEFCKTAGGQNWNFIHNRIKEYYQIFEKNSEYGIKQNTADCIIFKGGSVDEFLNSLKQNLKSVKWNDKGICTFGKFSFIQVSLKMSEEGAQLGKYTDYIQTKYINEDASVDDPSKISSEVEDIANDNASIKNDAEESLTNPDSSDLSFLNDAYKMLSDSEELNERAESTGNIIDMFWEKYEKNPNKNSSAIKKLYSDLNSNISTLQKVSKGNKVKLIENIKFNTSQKLSDILSLYKLVSNIMATNTIIKMIKGIKGDGIKVEDLLEAESEVYFGRNIFPLYKVYGKSKGESYHFLGTKQSFIKNKAEKLKKFGKDLPIFIVRLNTQEDGYLAIVTFSISDYNQSIGKLLYMTTRFGTNSSSHFTFVIEGTKLVPYDSIFKNK